MNTFVMDPQRVRLIQSDKVSASGYLLAGIVHEPISDLEGEVDESCPDDPNILLPDRSVLIVDDEDYIKELVETLLQNGAIGLAWM